MTIGILHVSGITAVLSASAAAFLDAAHGTRASCRCDRELRREPSGRAWDAAVAAPALQELAEQADIIFVGRDEAETLWGTT